MKRIQIIDGTVCSKGCVDVGDILTLSDGEALTLVQLGRAIYAPEAPAPVAVPAIDNTAGVQPGAPEVYGHDAGRSPSRRGRRG